MPQWSEPGPELSPLSKLSLQQLSKLLLRLSQLSRLPKPYVDTINHQEIPEV